MRRLIIRPRTTVALGVGLFLLPVPAAAQSPPPFWKVGATPITVIGGADDADAPVGITSAHRLPDGRVVLASSDPLELRIYSAAGALLRRIGRQGGGPGEFSGRVMVAGAAADSFTSFTIGNDRWALFDGRGTLLREWPKVGRASPGDLLLYRRSFTIRDARTPFACIRALVGRIPADSAVIRQVLVDAAGRFWVRPARAAAWTVYTLRGAPLGRVAINPDAELLEAGNGAVILKTRDADDIERIEVHSVAMPRAAAQPADPCRQASDTITGYPTGIAPARMRTDLRNMQIGAKSFRERSGHFPREIADLDYTPSTGADLRAEVLISNDRGWGARIVDRTNGVSCLMFVGTTLIPGWPSGSPACTADN